MLKKKKALLLIGSPKVKNSTSESLGNYLVEGLNKKGWIYEKLNILSTLKNDEEELIQKVNDTDLLIISFPLYVDSLPSSLIKAIELIGVNRREKKNETNQSLVAIVNSGFPEAFQSDTALRICESFSKKANFKWLGGLAMGCGPTINGRPIEAFGGMTKKIVTALDMATEAIINDEIISSEAIEIMANKMFPTWLYTLVASQTWKGQAKRYNMQKELYAKPYLK